MANLETDPWHGLANASMSKAAAAQVKALRQMEVSRQAHQDLAESSTAIFREVQGTLQDKVASSQEMVEVMSHNVSSVCSSLESLKQSHLQLLAALKAKEVPYALCAWRMGQRERRPLRENVRDPVAVALEEERAMLANVDKKLNDNVKKTQIMRSALENQRDLLQNNRDQKFQALKVDELCLQAATGCSNVIAQASPQGMFSRPITPSTPAGRPRTGGSVGSRPPSRGFINSPRRPISYIGVPETSVCPGHVNEINRQKEARRMKSEAANKGQAAAALRDENRRLVEWSARMLANAKAKTERNLQERVCELQQMRKRIESEAQETMKKQHHTKAVISETRSQMVSLEAPMQLCSMHSSWRKQRSCPEQIVDNVETRLEEQKWHLHETNQELRTHRQMEKGILTELDSHMERLKEDLRDKTTALAIDLNCLNQSPSNARPGTGMSARLPSP